MPKDETERTRGEAVEDFFELRLSMGGTRPKVCESLDTNRFKLGRKIAKIGSSIDDFYSICAALGHDPMTVLKALETTKDATAIFGRVCADSAPNAQIDAGPKRSRKRHLRVAATSRHEYAQT